MLKGSEDRPLPLKEPVYTNENKYVPEDVYFSTLKLVFNRNSSLCTPRTCAAPSQIGRTFSTEAFEHLAKRDPVGAHKFWTDYDVGSKLHVFEVRLDQVREFLDGVRYLLEKRQTRRHRRKPTQATPDSS